MKKSLIIVSLLICFTCLGQNYDSYIDNPLVALTDAQTSFKEGNYDKTIRLVKIYASLSGQNYNIELYSKADTCLSLCYDITRYEKDGNYNSIIQCCEKILTINPNDNLVKEKLSYNRAKTIGKKNGYEYVDLGLSVKWATCNIGANNPEGYGNYYAWGETYPKKDYKWSNLKYHTRGDDYNSHFSKYVASSKYGPVDRIVVLDYSDDVARANLGGDWRMPTKSEYEELISNCKLVGIKRSGVWGIELKSKINGNTIFFPAAGENDAVLKGVVLDGLCGNYLTSSLCLEESSKSHVFYFSMKTLYCRLNTSYRYEGNSVRPVCP